jgi:hypothetical protein
MEGYLVCKFTFKVRLLRISSRYLLKSNFQRLPGQPPLPRRADDASEEAATSKEAQEDMGPVDDSESTAV